eukprot:TRINITY_DN164227_c0_g1_i2.p1 TRINITY_DN164227_c0_g1~~TRINITY_DN164227_c0_g1_i2.p1  ORF type:complete len:2599 (+),score=787.91 TRINITY_DN164227_c0_g1_i2:57-7853(+)
MDFSQKDFQNLMILSENNPNVFVRSQLANITDEEGKIVSKDHLFLLIRSLEYLKTFNTHAISAIVGLFLNNPDNWANDLLNEVFDVVLDAFLTKPDIQSYKQLFLELSKVQAPTNINFRSRVQNAMMCKDYESVKGILDLWNSLASKILMADQEPTNSWAFSGIGARMTTTFPFWSHAFSLMVWMKISDPPVSQQMGKLPMLTLFGNSGVAVELGVQGESLCIKALPQLKHEIHISDCLPRNKWFSVSITYSLRRMLSNKMEIRIDGKSVYNGNHRLSTLNVTASSSSNCNVTAMFGGFFGEMAQVLAFHQPLSKEEIDSVNKTIGGYLYGDSADGLKGTRHLLQTSQFRPCFPFIQNVLPKLAKKMLLGLSAAESVVEHLGTQEASAINHLSNCVTSPATDRAIHVLDCVGNTQIAGMTKEVKLAKRISSSDYILETDPLQWLHMLASPCLSFGGVSTPVTAPYHLWPQIVTSALPALMIPRKSSTGEYTAFLAIQAIRHCLSVAPTEALTIELLKSIEKVLFVVQDMSKNTNEVVMSSPDTVWMQNMDFPGFYARCIKALLTEVFLNFNIWCRADGKVQIDIFHRMTFHITTLTDLGRIQGIDCEPLSGDELAHIVIGALEMCEKLMGEESDCSREVAEQVWQLCDGVLEKWVFLEVTGCGKSDLRDTPFCCTIGNNSTPGMTVVSSLLRFMCSGQRKLLEGRVKRCVHVFGSLLENDVTCASVCECLSELGGVVPFINLLRSKTECRLRLLRFIRRFASFKYVEALSIEHLLWIGRELHGACKLYNDCSLDELKLVLLLGRPRNKSIRMNEEMVASSFEPCTWDHVIMIKEALSLCFRFSDSSDYSQLLDLVEPLLEGPAMVVNRREVRSVPGWQRWFLQLCHLSSGSSIALPTKEASDELGGTQALTIEQKLVNRVVRLVVALFSDAQQLRECLPILENLSADDELFLRPGALPPAPHWAPSLFRALIMQMLLKLHTLQLSGGPPGREQSPGFWKECVIVMSIAADHLSEIHGALQISADEGRLCSTLLDLAVAIAPQLINIRDSGLGDKSKVAPVGLAIHVAWGTIEALGRLSASADIPASLLESLSLRLLALLHGVGVIVTEHAKNFRLKNCQNPDCERKAQLGSHFCSAHGGRACHSFVSLLAIRLHEAIVHYQREHNIIDNDSVEIHRGKSARMNAKEKRMEAKLISDSETEEQRTCNDNDDNDDKDSKQEQLDDTKNSTSENVETNEGETNVDNKSKSSPRKKTIIEEADEDSDLDDFVVICESVPTPFLDDKDAIMDLSQISYAQRSHLLSMVELFDALMRSLEFCPEDTNHTGSSIWLSSRLDVYMNIATKSLHELAGNLFHVMKQHDDHLSAILDHFLETTPIATYSFQNSAAALFEVYRVRAESIGSKKAEEALKSVLLQKAMYEGHSFAKYGIDSSQTHPAVRSRVIPLVALPEYQIQDKLDKEDMIPIVSPTMALTPNGEEVPIMDGTMTPGGPEFEDGMKLDAVKLKDDTLDEGEDHDDDDDDITDIKKQSSSSSSPSSPAPQMLFGNHSEALRCVKAELIFPMTKLRGRLEILSDSICFHALKRVPIADLWATSEEVPDWVPDKEGRKCTGCEKIIKAGLIRSHKHHCRRCGHVFCDDCSKHRLPLTDSGGDKPVRVCDGCASALMVLPTGATQEDDHISPHSMLFLKSYTWRFSDLSDVFPRRHLLTSFGFELINKNGSSHMLMFDGKQAFEVVAGVLNSQMNLPVSLTVKRHCGRSMLQNRGLTDLWVNRRISTFDYILQLNLLAGRSFNSPGRYPVFPWVLSDYTSAELDLSNANSYRDLSKSIGALNPERLVQCRNRMKEIEHVADIEKPYLFGSHYSNIGTVLYYLVRLQPFTNFHLEFQGGVFDHPDRLFNSISDTWDSVCGLGNDFKELIPEFFCCPDMFRNKSELDFGTRHDGTNVDDVKLPPWANNSPEKFVHLHRLALESDFVSCNIHHWIELIFGHKQLGKAANKADNLFHWLSYPNEIELDESDTTMRQAIETHITTCGQVPEQLFTKPHASRMSCSTNFQISRVGTPREVCPLPDEMSCWTADHKNMLNSFSDSLMDSLVETSPGAMLYDVLHGSGKKHTFAAKISLSLEGLHQSSNTDRRHVVKKLDNVTTSMNEGSAPSIERDGFVVSLQFPNPDATSFNNQDCVALLSDGSLLRYGRDGATSYRKLETFSQPLPSFLHNFRSPLKKTSQIPNSKVPFPQRIGDVLSVHAHQSNHAGAEAISGIGTLPLFEEPTPSNKESKSRLQRIVHPLKKPSPRFSLLTKHSLLRRHTLSYQGHIYLKDDSILFISNHGGLERWSINGESAVFKTACPSNDVISCICKCGDELVVAGHVSGRFSLWDVSENNLSILRTSSPLGSVVTSVAADQQLDSVVIGDVDGNVFICSLHHFTLLRKMTLSVSAPIKAITCLPSGNIVVSSDAVAYSESDNIGTSISSYSLNGVLLASTTVNDSILALNAFNGSRHGFGEMVMIAFSSAIVLVDVFELKLKHVITQLEDQTQCFTSACLSPDEKCLIAGQVSELGVFEDHDVTSRFGMKGKSYCDSNRIAKVELMTFGIPQPARDAKTHI